MSSSSHLATFSRRLDTLTEAYKQTLQSIHKIPRTPDPEDLADLTSTIRDSLNSLSEDLDLLNLEIEDVGGARPDSEESKTKLRLSVQAQRLGEDIKNARQSFRRTQIYVKKAQENTLRTERDDRLRQLREPPRTEAPQSIETTPTSSQVLLPSRRKREEKATDDDILVNASGDVLDALRQTHALMATELERSQFAQEILNQSSRELEKLNESYTDLDTMLKTSKGFVFCGSNRFVSFLRLHCSNS
jgi:protein transport protein SEC20